MHIARSIVAAITDDLIIQRIANFRGRCKLLLAKRRNYGYTLYRVGSGSVVARLCLIGQDDRVECSTGRCGSNAGPPPGHLVEPSYLDQALIFVAAEDIFWASQ